MSFSDAIQSGFQNYVTFSGRARRSEFWFWMLFVVLASIAAGIADTVIRTGGGLQALFGLATILPGLAVAVRRLHDTGRSAWWLLILYLPAVIGSVMFLFGVFAVFASMGLGVSVGIFGLAVMGLGGLVMLGGVAYWVYTFVQPSQPGANQYSLQPGAMVTEA